MHGNQWVLKIAVLKYYSVSKRGTTAKSNPKQATDPISLHTKFGDNSSNTFPLNERKPCVTPDIGRRTPDAGHRTSDIGHRTAKKAKIIYPPPRGVDIITRFSGDPNHRLDTRICKRFYIIPFTSTIACVGPLWRQVLSGHFCYKIKFCCIFLKLWKLLNFFPPKISTFRVF